MQEKLEKSQGEVYRLKAKLENAQGEQESLRQEMERAQGGVQRIHSDRDKVLITQEHMRIIVSLSIKIMSDLGTS